MKKLLVAGLLALAVTAASEQRASAWCKFSIGLGFNISYESTGHTWSHCCSYTSNPPPACYDGGCDNYAAYAALSSVVGAPGYAYNGYGSGYGGYGYGSAYAYSGYGYGYPYGYGQQAAAAPATQQVGYSYYPQAGYGYAQGAGYYGR